MGGRADLCGFKSASAIPPRPILPKRGARVSRNYPDVGPGALDSLCSLANMEQVVAPVHLACSRCGFGRSAGAAKRRLVAPSRYVAVSRRELSDERSLIDGRASIGPVLELNTLTDENP